MDVTGISVEKAQEIADSSIVSGYVNDAGNLVLVNGAGEEINAGAISVLGGWPVGSIFMALVPTSPAVLLGGGTWVRFGKGRVLVGVDEADGQFDAVREIGGAKTHLLTAAESGLQDHMHPFAGHIYAVNNPGSTIPTVSADNFQVAGGNVSGGARNASSAHNNLQPYITVFMWERTA